MTSFGFALRSISRDLKAGELTVLLIAIVLAVTAMTAVGFFTDRVARAVESQAAATLAADLVIRSPAPMPTSYLEQAEAAGLSTAEAVDFATVAIAGEDGRSLAIVVATDGGYPLRGEVLIADEVFGDTYVAAGIPEPGTAWAEPV